MVFPGRGPEGSLQVAGKPTADGARLQRVGSEGFPGQADLGCASQGGGIEDVCEVLLTEPCPQPLPESQVAEDGWSLRLGGHGLGLTSYHWGEKLISRSRVRICQWVPLGAEWLKEIFLNQFTFK